MKNDSDNEELNKESVTDSAVSLLEEEEELKKAKSEKKSFH